MTRVYDPSAWRQSARDHLLDYGVVDAHHHTLGRSQRRERNPGLWDWLSESYLFLGSLTAAGLDAEEFLASGLPDDRKVQMLLPVLRLTRATTYYRIVREGLGAAFDFDLDELNESNWQILDGMIRQANEQDDWFEQILGEKMNQRSGVLDLHVGGTLVDAISTIGSGDASNWYEYILKVRPTRDAQTVAQKTKRRSLDGQPSRAAFKIDSLLYGYLQCVRSELKELFGGNPEDVRELEGYLDYVDGVFDRISGDSRVVALKSAICGVRSLGFPLVDTSRAQRAFRVPAERLNGEDAACFENFMMHYICRRAGECGLPIQFHTGTPFAGCNDDRSCSPSSLTGLIATHPQTSFDLMHGGYPYYGECATLAVRFPNVYLNLAWLTMISDSETHRALDTWLDHVPANKIMWGGDCVFVEETYGTYLVSREQVIEVLANRIDQGQISPDDGLLYLRRIFCDNARELFGL